MLTYMYFYVNKACFIVLHLRGTAHFKNEILAPSHCTSLDHWSGPVRCMQLIGPVFFANCFSTVLRMTLKILVAFNFFDRGLKSKKNLFCYALSL